MKKIVYILLITIASAYVVIYNLVSQDENKITADKIKIIVQLDKEVVSGNTLTTKVNDIRNENIQRLFTKYGAVQLQAAFTNRYDKEGYLKPNTKSSTAGIWQQIILKNNNMAKELIATLKKEEGVLNAYMEKPIAIKPCIAPTDPLYTSQWHLHSLVSANADIDAEQAWDINKGRNDVIIAVCDGGVDYTHPDLDPGNRSRVITGYDFGNNDNNPMDDLPDGSGRYGGHGTHIAGIIGAIPNNGQVAGVMWNCKIMPVKMVGTGSLEIRYPFGGYNWDFSTTAFPSDVADAIDYAVNNGAHVINLSYGFPDMGFPINEVILRVPLLYDAILNAYNNNVVIIAAMGNDYQNGNPVQYPAKFPEVIAVGNTRNTNPPSRNPGSSTGPHICVSAPGTDILSTIRGGNPNIKTGTSMSAPVVSGVAGLIISQGKDRGFNLTNDDVRHIIERTAVDIGTAGFDNETGYGLVNANNALSLLDEPNEVFHYNSTGGTSVKTQTINQWILLTNRWGLAAGTYYSVDQYKITKHVTFNIPFCSVPQVWLRDRESSCISAANPNIGRPFCIITNVTTTGFDLEYFAYFVPTNTLGQIINKWVPVLPASTNVAYTAVGQPNIAASIGPITGPSVVCNIGTLFTVNNPYGATITWNPGPNITRVSPQGSNPCTFSSTGTGSSWIDATINGSCGNIPLPRKTVWAGNPNTPTEIIPFWNNGMEFGNDSYYDFHVNPQLGTTGYTWVVGGGVITDGQGTNWITVKTNKITGSNNINFSVSVRAEGCAASSYFVRTGWVVPGTGGSTLLFTPNPAIGETTMTIETTSPEVSVDQAVEWEMEVYSPAQNLKEKQTKLKGNSTKIQTTGWQEGVYVVRVKYKDEILTGKLVVKK